MNWFKENPFLSGLLAVAVVGLGALGYLVSQAAAAYGLANESYVAAVTKLHSLQNRSPFPSQENLAALKASYEDYQARVGALRQKMSGMEMALNMDITPQQFQDELRSAVNALREKATASGVELPENFYLGFDQYQTTVPPAQATPYLDRQFRVIRAIAERLVDFRVQSIDGIVRTPLPQEAPVAAAPAPAAAPAQGNRPAAAKAPTPVLERFPFQITFTAEQGKLRVAFNALLGKEQFLIVRSLSLTNSNPNPPTRGETTAPVQDPFAAASSPQQTGETASNLQVIFGRELVKAVMDLEMIDFVDTATN